VAWGIGKDSHEGYGRMIAPTTAEAQRRFHAQAAQHLPLALADELANHLTLITYAADSTLILQGSSADVVFWVISGVVKVYCLIPNGNRILLRLASSGDLLGYPTLVGPEDAVVQPFDVQALTKCTVAMFSRDNLIRTLEKLDQPALVRLFEHFNEPWGLAAHRLVTFLGYSFRQRLELTFKNLVSRFGVEDERGLLLNLKLSHMDFAEMIGSSRPMATVLIGEMVAERSLYRQGNHQYLVPRSAAIFPRPQLSALPRIGRSKPVLTHPTFKRPRQSVGSNESHLRTGFSSPH
jgi:CRP-like cAMP-binding protein